MMQRAASKQFTAALRRNMALRTTSKRYSSDHPPAQNPIFKEEDGTPFSADRFNGPVNTVYGVKFPHPMNYQGHVPVTPQRFRIGDPELKPPESEVIVNARVPSSLTFTLFSALGFTVLLPYCTIGYSIDFMEKAKGVRVHYDDAISTRTILNRFFLLQNGDLSQFSDEHKDVLRRIIPRRNEQSDEKTTIVQL